MASIRTARAGSGDGDRGARGHPATTQRRAAAGFSPLW
ncbi:Hypothetical Protein sle_36860 [Streptomyces leeuwenhoekii]|uniref:Uncharacterized protein n=1 Tax=Streptomyces leeuwenhoekii TaxID=1437453 RepID=A0A0F7W296_STRLW|nr:Hypothetical Protein sle_36860 [Streptomyces leeuwenhoekii]